MASPLSIGLCPADCLCELGHHRTLMDHGRHWNHKMTDRWILEVRTTDTKCISSGDQGLYPSQRANVLIFPVFYSQRTCDSLTYDYRTKGS